MLNVNTAKYQF